MLSIESAVTPASASRGEQLGVLSGPEKRDQDLALPQAIGLVATGYGVRLRSAHLEDDVAAGPERVDIVNYRRARIPIRLIRETRGLARTRLDGDLKAEFPERGHDFGGRRNAPFARMNLPRNSYSHWQHPPFGRARPPASESRLNSRSDYSALAANITLGAATNRRFAGAGNAVHERDCRRRAGALRCCCAGCACFSRCVTRARSSRPREPA